MSSGAPAGRANRSLSAFSGEIGLPCIGNRFRDARRSAAGGDCRVIRGDPSFVRIGSARVGLLIVALARNQIQALQFAQVVFLPSIMLSGFVFPQGS